MRAAERRGAPQLVPAGQGGRPPGRGLRRPRAMDPAAEPAPGFGFRLRVWPDTGPQAQQHLLHWLDQWADTLGLQHTGGPLRGRIIPGDRDPDLVDALDFVATAIDRPGVRSVAVGRPGDRDVSQSAEVLTVGTADPLVHAALDLYRHGRLDAAGCVAALGGYVRPGRQASGWRLL